jgi:hypothetical protein
MEDFNPSEGLSGFLTTVADIVELIFGVGFEF